MKKKFTNVILVMALISSCSSDNNNDIANEIIEPSALLGWWLMTDIQLLEDPNDELIIVDEVVDQLVQLDCNLVTFFLKRAEQ